MAEQGSILNSFARFHAGLKLITLEGTHVPFVESCFAGCATSTPQENEYFTAIYEISNNQNPKPLSAYLEKYPSLSSLKNWYLYDACFAYYLERNYTKFDNCAELFLARLEPDQPWEPFSLHTSMSWYAEDYGSGDTTGTRAEARAMLLTWRSLMRVDLENLNGAESDINEAVRLIEEETENPTTEFSFIPPFRYPLRFISVTVYRGSGDCYGKIRRA